MDLTGTATVDPTATPKFKKLRLNSPPLGYDSIEELCKLLCEPFQDLPAVLHHDHLATLLLTPLTIKIRCKLQLLDKYEDLITNSDGPVFDLIQNMVSSIVYSANSFPNREPSEDDFHFYWDTIITNVLCLLSAHTNTGLIISRDSTGRARPDFLCWVSASV